MSENIEEREVKDFIKEVETNINAESEMLVELRNYVNNLESAREIEKGILNAAVNSIKARIKTVNAAIPGMLNHISLATRLPSKAIKTNLERINFQGKEANVNVTLLSKDREKFLQELNVSEDIIKKLREKKIIKKEEAVEYKSARGYLKISNRFFLETARSMIKKETFNVLGLELRKANIEVLLPTYVAMMLFTTLISFFISLIIMVFFLFFNIGILSGSMISLYNGSYLLRLAKLILIPIIIPVATFFAIYYYPSTEKSSIAKKIDQEIPFAVIHMSAISGSGIEPSKIFSIIGLNDEYPNLRKEIRKVMNQINLYGYDLVSALNNVSKSTPSEKLAELFSGLSTTISTGGNLGEFFEKRAESLMTSYRLERESYTKVAETFMDIYISVVIATPMILLLLLVMLSISGIDLGFSPEFLSIGITGAVAVINVIFLGVLHLKQPTY